MDISHSQLKSNFSYKKEPITGETAVAKVYEKVNKLEIVSIIFSSFYGSSPSTHFQCIAT